MAVETFSSRERRFYFARLQVECMRGLMGTYFDCHPDESGRANRRSRDGRSADIPAPGRIWWCITDELEAAPDESLVKLVKFGHHSCS